MRGKRAKIGRTERGFKPRIDMEGGFIEGYGGPGRHWIKGVYNNRRLFRFDSISESDVAVKGERQRVFWEKQWPSKDAFLAAIAKKELNSPLCDNCKNPIGSTGTMCLNKNWCQRFSCREALAAAIAEHKKNEKDRETADAARWERARLALKEDSTTGFHWKNGWFFKRLDDGSVRVSRFDGTYLLAQATIPATEWASIVCAVSKDGETDQRWNLVQDFHGREG